MTDAPKTTYRRQGANGTLKLGGSLDIFEAENLLATARRALADAKMRSLRVDMAQVERIDVATIQILCTLKHDLCAAEREFRVEGMRPALSQKIVQLGISL